MDIDRSEINRALAKAIAYAQCGKAFEADQWASKLVRLLGSSHILRSDLVACNAGKTYEPRE